MGWDEDKGIAKIVSDSKGGSLYILFQELKMPCGPTWVAMRKSQYKLKCMANPEGRAR
jgi:hypothetical protein